MKDKIAVLKFQVEFAISEAEKTFEFISRNPGYKLTKAQSLGLSKYLELISIGEKYIKENRT